ARLARPQPRGSRDGPRLRSGARLPRGDAAADLARHHRRLDAGVHAVARRSRDREFYHGPRLGDLADPDLFRSAARRKTRDQRHLHAGDRADRGRDRGGLAGLETVERAGKKRRAEVGPLPSLRAKRSNPEPRRKTGLLRRYAPRNDGIRSKLLQDFTAPAVRPPTM